MTCYYCDNCRRHEHMSRLGEFIKIIDIGLVSINKTIWLCKWCLTKAGIKYNVVDDWVEVEDLKDSKSVK